MTSELSGGTDYITVVEDVPEVDTKNLPRASHEEFISGKRSGQAPLPRRPLDVPNPVASFS